MDSNSIDDYSISILLRHLKGTAPLSPDGIRLGANRDLEFLHFHWALSQPVRALACYLLENRHETQTLLTFRSETHDALAKGRLDARATMVYRLRNGSSTALVSTEPVRSYANGPNQILAWVMHWSTQILSHFLSSYKLSEAYQANAEATLQLLNRVLRLECFRSINQELNITRRPLPASQLAAQRSRRQLYRHAYQAYRLFVAVEELDKVAIAQLLQGTLLGPLEVWRRLELAIALAVGEALSFAIERPLDLAILGMDARKPILCCGTYAVYWQTLTEHYVPPLLEPSEERSAQILSSYGLNAANDRPDLIVTNKITGEPIGIIEVKYHAGENPLAQFREAIYQLVRYSRGYGINPSAILERSFVAMNTDVPRLKEGGSGTPAAFSFSDIISNQLSAWIKAKWLG